MRVEDYECFDCGYEWEVVNESPTQCPECTSTDVEPVSTGTADD